MRRRMQSKGTTENKKKGNCSFSFFFIFNSFSGAIAFFAEPLQQLSHCNYFYFFRVFKAAFFHSNQAFNVVFLCSIDKPFRYYAVDAAQENNIECLVGVKK